ncbi:hypothetical protein AB0F72_22220 [Actinoplanes sp. NPDC023936]|uniref:hypothetical protein n=1 Tax=Actinoplanes sp. NPDC023936 TaxID=3154910 RepID=UPI003409BCF9
MDDALTVLRREFEATEGSFLLCLRGADLVWDRAAFSQLEQTMRTVCKQYEGRDDLPRWMAEGFYYVSHFVTEWTSHPNFPRPEPVQYYHDCLERLRDLADWFFHGWHAYQEPHVWRDL